MANKTWLVKAAIRVLCVFCVAYGFPAKGASVGLDFYSQCPLLLRQAPNFAKECVLHARPWGQVFNDIPENHGAYIVVPKSSSNFALGCTLDAKRLIDYLGVYYSLNSDNFKYADTAPIAFVDFDGNFGVFPENGLANFVAVRRFSIDPRLEDSNYDLANFTTCNEPKNFPSGAVPDSRGDPYYIFEKRLKIDVWITGCIFQGVCDPSVPYLEIRSAGIKTDNSKIIYTPTAAEAGMFFITDDGGALVPIGNITSDCSNYLAGQAKGEDFPFVGPNMVREICLSNERNSR